MTHLAMTLSKLASTGEPQELFAGLQRPDGRVTLIADENPSMPSRAAAVRELLRRGLAAEGFEIAPDGKHSGEFTVTEPARAKGSV